MLSDGFDLTVLNPSDKKGNDMYVSLLLRITRGVYFYINRSSWPNKTQISEKKFEAISNHGYKRSNKTQITFMDKNIYLIINSKFIGSQQTHRKKSYIK